MVDEHIFVIASKYFLVKGKVTHANNLGVQQNPDVQENSLDLPVKLERKMCVSWTDIDSELRTEILGFSVLVALALILILVICGLWRVRAASRYAKFYYSNNL